MMIQANKFISHSGILLPFKIDCDAFTIEDWENIANIISRKLRFSYVYGIPTGGLRLAHCLVKYCGDKNAPVLIVDDVMTTGNSMLNTRNKFPNSIGFVVFDRSDYINNWISCLFRVSRKFDVQSKDMESGEDTPNVATSSK